MTLYLTDKTRAEEIRKAKACGFVHGVKLYPAGATTNSDHGVTDIAHAMPALQAMAEVGMPLLVHGEVTDADIDVFDREAVFIERVMKPLLAKLPNLKVVFEHITTREAAEFVAA
ncbi:dihydroorotase, partial (plasmid) [Chromobacterium amazonense]|nr:dihydroorotase [Chromobacterium amazonense]